MFLLRRRHHWLGDQYWTLKLSWPWCWFKDISQSSPIMTDTIDQFSQVTLLLYKLIGWSWPGDLILVRKLATYYSWHFLHLHECMEVSNIRIIECKLFVLTIHCYWSNYFIGYITVWYTSKVTDDEYITIITLDMDKKQNKTLLNS